MAEEYIGKAISINCKGKLGVFQGIIKDMTEQEITIVRAFRNGVPLRNQDTEVTFSCSDIIAVNFMPGYLNLNSLPPLILKKPTAVKGPHFSSLIPQTNESQPRIPNILNANTEIVGKGASPSSLLEPMCNVNLNSSEFPQISKYCEDSFCFPTTSPNKLALGDTVAQFFENIITPKADINISSNQSSNSGSVVGSFGSTHSSKTADATNGLGIENNYLLNGHVNGIDNINCMENGGIDGHQMRYRQDSYNDNCNSNSSGYGNRYDHGSGHGSSFGNGFGSSFGNGNGNGSTKRTLKKSFERRENSIKQTFGTSVDDPSLNEDFDFEANLALFDKQALWNALESNTPSKKFRRQKKYRHDENILAPNPIQLSQIQSPFVTKDNFVTDEGLIIPTIPIFARNKIENMADAAGLSFFRQNDILARGATDLAIQVIGGAHRLTPSNSHQWPIIAIICERSDKVAVSRGTNIGASTGRQLASHGLKVFLYLNEDANKSDTNEMALFSATENSVVTDLNVIPKPDLVILSCNTTKLFSNTTMWINKNRAPVFAIDPPPQGYKDVSIKFSIFSILPLEDISSASCGKLFLCNVGIPHKFYCDAGIKYKSPFGHKFVIPLHAKD